MKCPVCDSSKFRSLFRTIDDRYEILACGDCGLGITTPPEVQSTDDYDEAFYNRGDHLLSRLWNQITMGRKLSFMTKGKPRGRILDIGCGVGALLENFNPSRYERHGLEISKSGAAIARSKGIGTIYDQPLEKLDLPDNHFDIVIMSHVLEHVADPGSLLAEVRRILKPDGVFITAQPDMDSVDFDIAREKFFHLDVPNHLYHYTPKSLNLLLEKHGLKVARTRYPVFEYPQVLAYSLLSKIPFDLPRPIRLGLLLPLGPFCILAAWVLSAFGRTNTFEVVASPGVVSH